MMKRGGPLALTVIFTTILIDFMGYLILVPVLPEYLESLNADRTDQGLAIGLYMFALVLALPIWGWVTDRVGRRPVLVTCLVGTSLSFALMANATSLQMFFVARVLQGVFGASVGTAQAYISDVTSGEGRARGFGLIGAAGSLGLLGGPLVGGLLYEVDPALVFQAPSVLALAAAAGAFFFLEESRSADYGSATWKDLLRSAVPAPLLIIFGVHRPRILLYLYLFFHFFVAFGAVEAMFPNYARERFGWEPREVGLFLSGIAIVMAVTQVRIGSLISWIGEFPLLLGGLALAGTALVAMRDVSSAWMLYGAGLGLAVGFGVVVPTFTTLFANACETVPDSGAYHAHSQAMLNLGRGTGSVLGGLVAQSLSYQTPFFLAGLTVLASIGLVVVGLPLLRAPKPATGARPASGESSSKAARIP